MARAMPKREISEEDKRIVAALQAHRCPTCGEADDRPRRVRNGEGPDDVTLTVGCRVHGLWTLTGEPPTSYGIRAWA